MKKVIFSLALLLTCSLLGYAQKGISYQAIILDPKPIEIPGQDISGQPFVNGAVSLKFRIYSANLIQEFEEVHTTQTDAFGMVNVLIGSQNTGAFSSLVWDSNQKSLHVLVSFDQGGTYTKVSEQQLTYNPLALFAETASKLSETLSIAGGGTGATTAVAARTNLGLGNVDNTSDAAKPISTATQGALATKANTNEVNTALATKANAAEVTSALATKANAAEVTISLGLKEDVSNKANTPLGTSTSLYPTQNAVKTYVDAQIASATIPDADASNKGKIQLAGDLSGTAAAPTVPGLALKANASEVTTSLALKEDVSNKSNTPLGTSTSLYPTQNAVKTYVDAQVAAATIPDANGSTKGKIQLAGDLGGTAAAPTVPGLTLKLDANQKGVANGVASLNASGIIPSSQLPPVTVSSTTVVGSDAAMIALSNQTVGSIAVRTDVNKNYVLSALPASTLGNWIELLTPGAPVQTVNGYIGTVNLTKTDLGLSNVNNTTDLNKPISTATQNALDSKANGAAVDAALATKLSTLDANAALALKANSTDVTTALATKINTTDANAALALKANSADVTNALATKISTTDANAALALKANSTDVNTALATKLSTTDANAALALKANSADVTTALATKISTADATAALALKLDANKVAAANGVASLDALGKVPTDQIPAVSFSSVKVLGSEAEMLGLGSAVVGSVVIRTDESKNYVLAQADPSVRANWIQLLTPAAPVQAVNGKTGTLSITATDLGLENVQNTSDANKPVSSATQTELDKKVDKVSGKDLSTNDYTTVEKSKLAAITGTNTGDQDLSSFATTTALNTKVDKVTGKGLSTNDYTTTEKDKLAAITGITNLATEVSGTLAVANGGTGATTLTGLVKGSGTSAFTAAVAGTDYQAPLTLTTTGSGAATLSGTTLNIPATTTFSLPTASASDLGGVKVGTNLSISGGVLSADLSAANISGTVAVGKGGTGATTLAANNVLLGNGTSAVQVVAPGATGNVLTSNGTTWTSAAAGVPYTGATGAVNLGAYDLSVNSLTVGRGRGGVESNTAVGLASLAANTTGAGNTASGYGTLYKNQTGGDNTAIGQVSLFENLSGIKNTGVGSFSLWKNTASNNTAVGYGALAFNTNGANNVAQGVNSLSNNTSGSDNTAIGMFTLVANTTGSYNTALGSLAEVNASNLSNTTAIGYGARVFASNTIQLGADGSTLVSNGVSTPTTAITNVKTSGTLTLKDVTYPNTHRSTAGDVLTINSSGTASWAAPSGGVSGTVSVGNGGTGATTFTSGSLLKGNGTSAISAATAGTDYSAGTSALGTGILKSTTSTGALTIATAADFPTLNQNTTGNAANVTGTVAVGNGGTGATTLTGYVKGTGSTAMTASASIPVADVTGAAPLASPTFTGTLTAPIYASTPQALTDAATISWNPSSGLNASVTLADNRTLSFSTAPPTGAYGTLVVKQDATGGRTLTLPSAANKILGSSSTTTIGLSTAANAIDIVNFYFDGTNYFWNVGQGYGTAATSSATNIAGGAAGSIPYQTAAGATSLLPIGSNGQILTLASGLPSWAAAPVTGVTSASSPLTISSNAISLGTVPVASGGTGATTLTGYVKGTGTTAMTASAAIPLADVTGAAPLDSPAFTGTPSLPTGTTGVTQAATNNSTALATTAYVKSAIRLNNEEINVTTQTGATATFTLAQTPLGAKVFMYINGIRIKNGAYAVSGVTVTYTAANNNSYTLVAGDRIQFDYAY